MADGTGAGTSLVDRAKRILLEPKAEWDRIDAEPMTVGGIFKGWVLILALIPAVCSFIGMLVFGLGSILGVQLRLPASYLISNAVITYVMIVSGLFLYALLIDALAPTFKGTRNQVQAVKLVAFSATPALLAGVFYLLPQLSILAIIGAIYSLYLLFLGLPKLMKTPPDKTVAYIATVVVAALIIGLIAGVLIGAVSQPFMPAGPSLVVS